MAKAKTKAEPVLRAVHRAAAAITETRYHGNAESTNEKVAGPKHARRKIAVTTTSADSCGNCPMLPACYATSGPLSLHWMAVGDGRRGWDLVGFLEWLRALPSGYKLRHNQAGDFPRRADGSTDADAVRAIGAAASHLEGFTYTHHEPTPEAVAAFRDVTAAGFTVNLSADSRGGTRDPLEVADELAATGLPVAVAIPVGHALETAERGMTPGGLRVVVCPEQTGRKASCADCMLCRVTRPEVFQDKRGNNLLHERRPIIAFRAHGTGAANV